MEKSVKSAKEAGFGGNGKSTNRGTTKTRSRKEAWTRGGTKKVKTSRNKGEGGTLPESTGTAA